MIYIFLGPADSGKTRAARADAGTGAYMPATRMGPGFIWKRYGKQKNVVLDDVSETFIMSFLHDVDYIPQGVENVWITARYPASLIINHALKIAPSIALRVADAHRDGFQVLTAVKRM